MYTITRQESSLGDGAKVHEVAVAAARAGILLVLPARGLPEVGDGRKLHQDGAPIVEAPCEPLERPCCSILVPACVPSWSAAYANNEASRKDAFHCDGASGWILQ